MNHFLVIILFSSISFVFAESDNFSNDTNAETIVTTNKEGSMMTTTVATKQDLKRLTKKRCSRHYTVNCLKIDMISMVDNLGRTTDYQVLPGVNVVSNPSLFDAQKTVDTKMTFSAKNVSEQLDDLLAQRLNSFLKSLSLSFRLFDKHQRKGKTIFGSSIFDSLIRSYLPVDGRDKKTGKFGSTLVSAALLAGGALLWIGLSSLTAMASKALAASLLSILITCITAYKTSGSHKSTTYEIVAKPMYSHGYSSDVQDAHSAPTSQQYGRNMEWDKMAGSEQIPVRDAHRLAYVTHVRPIYRRSVRNSS